MATIVRANSSSGSSSSGVFVVNVRDRGAAGNGVADDGTVLRTVLAAGGDIFLPAGTYRLVATSTTPTAPAGTRIRGVPGKTIINLDTDTPGAYREFLANGGDTITIEGITVNRVADFQCVMFPVRGTTGYTLRDVVLNGNRDIYATNFCHAFQVGVQNTPATDRFRIIDSTITKCSYGLFQTNTSTATLSNIQVRGCTFSQNTSTDLEFNSPVGTTTGVWVENCTFTNNARGATAGAGFAVGLAHIVKARVRNCIFTGYDQEPIHVEDYSEDVLIDGNSFTDCARVASYLIQIISGSRRVRVRGNYIDATTNTNTPFLISAQAGGTGNTPGGRTTIAPSDVIIQNNQMLCGSNARGIYLEAVLRGLISGNEILGAGSAPSGTYSGGTNYGINIYTGTATNITGNTIRGLLWGIFPRTDATAGLGAGSTVTGNIFHECLLGAGFTNMAECTISDNLFYKCQYPMMAGRSNSGYTPKSAAITGNHATGCLNPFSIYGITQVTTTNTATIGSGVTVAISALSAPLPSGTVVTFTGGGVLTLTAAATFAATSLVGNLATANLANAESGTAYVAHSTDSTQNLTLADNNDSFWGAAGYGARTATVSTAYRIRGHENIVIATAAITVTLPPAANSVGREYAVKNTSGGTVTVAAAGGTVDTPSVATGAAARYVSDGTTWQRF